METTILLFLLFVLVLSLFLGFEIALATPSPLHTLFVSGSNAVSGITVLAAILAAGLAEGGNNDFAALLGGFAVAFAAANAAGGWLAAKRMLDMFRDNREPTKR